MTLFEIIFNIYNLINNIIDELKKESTIFLHKYLGIDE